MPDSIGFIVFEHDEQLRLEANTANPCVNPRQSWAAQIMFLQGHAYFTSAARERRKAARQQNTVLLEQRVWAAGDEPAWSHSQGGAESAL